MAKRDRLDTDVLEEIARLLAIQLRLLSGNQTKSILEMSKAGFGAARIAALLGTSANTVNVTIQRAKKKAGVANHAEVE